MVMFVSAGDFGNQFDGMLAIGTPPVPMIFGA